MRRELSTTSKTRKCNLRMEALLQVKYKLFSISFELSGCIVCHVGMVTFRKGGSFLLSPYTSFVVIIIIIIIGMMMMLKMPPPPSSLSSSSSPALLLVSSFLRKPSLFLPKPPNYPNSSYSPFSLPLAVPRPMNILKRLGFGTHPYPSTFDSTIPQSPDDDVPAPGQIFSQFGAGCFWGVEIAFQRVPGVTKTEVGYSQGLLHNPTYEDVCTGTTHHNEIVRVQYDPNECSYQSLLDVFWSRHDPTSLNRQGNDVGTQYRSGIYYYTPEQEKAAKESLEQQQELLNRKIVTEVLPAKKFYRAEEYHQQYLAKGGRFGFKQSTVKGCNDPIRCYG